jgi:hypothetical protein
MAKKTRIEITVERRQRTVVRPRRRPRAAWCGECAGLVHMLTADEAAVLTETTARDVFRLVEAGELHFLEVDGGMLLVCPNSLEALRRSSRRGEGILTPLPPE